MSEQAREAERRLIREHPPEKCMICSLPAPDSDDWQGHHERIADLERQLAEAKTILSDLPDHSDVDAAVFEANALRGQLAEAQGKLAAVDKELHTVSCRSKKTCEHAVCGLARRVARILKGDA